MTENEQPQLDGLGIDLNPSGQVAESPMRAAVRHVIEALDAENLLKPWHAAHCALALELADAIGRSRGKASAAAMASAQLMACLEALPTPKTLSTGDVFEQWLQSVEAETNERAS